MHSLHVLPDAQHEHDQERIGRKPAAWEAAPPSHDDAPRTHGTRVASMVAQRPAGRPWLLAGRRANRGRAGGIAPAPSLWFRTFRRWSPGMMPPLLGTLLLLLAGALATHRIGQSAPLVDAHTLLTLFLMYLIGGTVYGLLLYLTSSATTWWIVLASGVAAYLLATVVLLGGAPPPPAPPLAFWAAAAPPPPP